MQKHSQPPPLELLHANCARLLPRLSLIPELSPWLDLCGRELVNWTPYTLLRKCLTLGAPMCVLLDLLGTPTVPSDLALYIDALEDGFTTAAISQEERDGFCASFVHRVHMLEIQGRLVYGEVLRVDDFHGGTISGLCKILRTVQRVLSNLQESYPGLYVLPDGAEVRRKALVQIFLDTEQAHVEGLTSMADFENPWPGPGQQTLAAVLECLNINRSRILGYHQHILQRLVDASSQSEEWDRIFAFDGKRLGTQAIGAYGSYCANYLTLANAVCEQGVSPHGLETTEAVFQLLSSPLQRICQYPQLLRNIIKLTLPDSDNYDTLCTTAHALSSVSSSITEAATEIRTMYASEILKRRAYVWNSAAHPDELGTLLLDDIIMEWGESRRCAVFLFEAALLMCDWDVTATVEDSTPTENPQESAYPIAAWDLGPALRSAGPLNLVCMIKTEWLREVRCTDPDSLAFEVDWSLTTQVTEVHTLVFCPAYAQQCEQWCNLLRLFVPVAYSPKLATRSLSSAAVDAGAFSEDDDEGNDPDEPGSRRRRSHARTWSVIGRKGPHSESSSMVQQREHTAVDVGCDYDQLSPDMLPNLYKTSQTQSLLDVKRIPSTRHRQKKSTTSSLRSTTSSASVVLHEEPESAIYDLDKLSPGVIAALFSPLSAGFPISGNSSAEAHIAQFDMPPTPPPGKADLDPIGLTGVLEDLTSRIERDDRYPFAQGGFADVWKGTWHRGVGDDVKVAIKVIRSSPSDDPSVEAKLKKRLRRELNVWRRLEHDHVLPLYGITCDFGHYTSMVCPFLELGSVTRYLERSGDILSMTDRLQLLCEIASGLAYLHSFSVVHGDLTGSNILITDDRKACLCDFGLSSIVVDIKGTSYFTSSIGGAVRWAAAELYKVYDDEDSDADEGNRVVTTFSDIYSFGSMVLEILSGRIPYHYVRNDAQVVIELNRGVKPRRPAQTFMHDSHWNFIQRCWRDEPTERPSIQEVCDTMSELHRASLDFRRHTY